MWVALAGALAAHLRGARHRPAAAAPAALLAGRGGGLVGIVEAVRDRWPYAFPWGRLAMSQSVAPDVRWVAVGGAPLLSFLLALTGAMIARAALCFLGGSDPPQTPPDHGGATRPPVPPREGRPAPPDASGAPDPSGAPHAVGAGAGRGGDGGPGPRGRPAAGRPDRRRADGPVAAIQGNVPRARNLPQLLNDSEVTQNHAAATLKLAAAGQGRSAARACPGGLAGEQHQPGPAAEPRHLRRARRDGGRHRPPGPGRRGPAGPAAQRRPALGARPRPDHVVRQARAGAVRRVHPVPRPHLQLQFASVAAAGELHPGPSGGRLRRREDQAG